MEGRNGPPASHGKIPKGQWVKKSSHHGFHSSSANPRVTSHRVKTKWAALFDWDGVIIDSARHHQESWERLAQEEHLTLPPKHFEQSFGRKNEWIIPNLLHWTDQPDPIRRLSLRKEALYREIVIEWGIEPLPGAVTFLQELKTADIPRIIGSSTHRLNIETALGKMGLASAFDGMITAEDVSTGKPDPEVFLKAAALAGVPPARGVVFEDAHVGIQAARRGGLHIVALSTTHPPETLTDAELVVPNLSAITIPLLEEKLKL